MVTVVIERSLLSRMFPTTFEAPVRLLIERNSARTLALMSASSLSEVSYIEFGVRNTTLTVLPFTLMAVILTVPPSVLMCLGSWLLIDATADEETEDDDDDELVVPELEGLVSSFFGFSGSGVVAEGVPSTVVVSGAESSAVQSDGIEPL